MKKLISRYTTDAVPRWHVLTADELLSANSPGKAIALGARWDGDLKPKYDTLIEQGEKLHGFLVNHVVGAEPNPVIEKMLGRVWRGSVDLQTALVYSNEGTGVETAERVVDTSEALAAVNQFHQSLGTEQINTAQVGDAVRRMKRARDAVRDRARSTGDRQRQHPGIMPRRTMGDFSKPASIAELNRRNRDRWDVQTGDTTASARTEVRDAQAAVSRARAGNDPYALNRALNVLSEKTWAERNQSFTHDGHIQITHPTCTEGAAPMTMAERNEFNRRHWAQRG